MRWNHSAKTNGGAKPHRDRSLARSDIDAKGQRNLLRAGLDPCQAGLVSFALAIALPGVSRQHAVMQAEA